MPPDMRRSAAEARALTLALALVARMDWRLGRGPILGHAFAPYLYVPDPQLLVVPTAAGLDFATRQVTPIVRDTRSDALVVSRLADGAVSFALATWARRETVWTYPLTLWLAEGESWLVSPAESTEPLAFRLRHALHHAGAPPWSDAQTRAHGYACAAAWMTKVAP